MVESYRDQDLAKLFYLTIQEDEIPYHYPTYYYRYDAAKKDIECIGCKLDANKDLARISYAFNFHMNSPGPIDKKQLTKDLIGMGRLVHVSHTGVRVAATASVSDIAIERMADEIQKFIVAGKLTPQEVEMLPVHGLDPKVIDRWKQKYASSIKEAPKVGLTCCKCKEYYPYADAANQPDGSFKCYGCRI